MATDEKSIIPPTPSAAEYAGDVLDRPPVPDVSEPYGLFRAWLADATRAEPNDANAMVLATVDGDGLPDARVVLLKDVTEAGFTFYTNTLSAKGQQLAGHARAALNFHWKSLRRQVRVRGSVLPVSAAEADAYFASRARESQIGAWASTQSATLSNRTELEDAVKTHADTFAGGPVPRPDHWSGYRLTPQSVEFWQDQPYRLHDRLLLERAGDTWATRRLYP